MCVRIALRVLVEASGSQETSWTTLLLGVAMERPLNKEAHRLVVESVESALRSLLARVDFDELDPPSPMGRPRLVTAALFWSSVLAGVVRGNEHMRDLWRSIVFEGVWDHSRVAVEDEALYRRCKSDAWERARDLFFAVQSLVSQPSSPQRRESRFAPGGVYAFDDTVLDEVEKRSTALRSVQETVLPGRVSTVFDVLKGQIVDVEISDDPNQNEKKVARKLLSMVPKQSLILFDLGYFSFRWFDELTDEGAFYVSRLRAGTSLGDTLFEYYRSDTMVDRVVWLGKYRADRAKHAVRVIEIRRGSTWHRYMTNQLDAKKLWVQDVVRLYSQRWDIELAFKLIKRVLGLATIWSADPHAIRLQVFAILTVAWVVRAMRKEIAQRLKVPVDDVSEEMMMVVIPLVMRGGGPDPIGYMLSIESKGKGCVVRRSRRINYEVPEVGGKLPAMPSDIVLERTPRYAGRKCDRQAS